jgi:hypothetical protein
LLGAVPPLARPARGGLDPRDKPWDDQRWGCAKNGNRRRGGKWTADGDNCLDPRQTKRLATHTLVMPGLVPGIQRAARTTAGCYDGAIRLRVPPAEGWIPGTSPGMTGGGGATHEAPSVGQRAEDRKTDGD